MNLDSDSNACPGLCRGEQTRAKLLEQAVRLFAKLGYNAVSTRELARAAGVNHAAIGFHFKGKRGLHSAVIEIMLEEFKIICEAFTSRLEVGLSAWQGERPELSGIVIQAVTDLVMVYGQSEKRRDLGVLFLREYVDLSDAYEKIHREAGNRMLESITKLARASGETDPAGPLGKIKIYCVLSQLTNLGRDRGLILQQLGPEAYEPENLILLAGIIGRGICGTLGLPVQENLL